MTDIQSTSTIHNAKLYRAVWRWHFYASLFVMPFLLSLAVSGLLMLLAEPLDQLMQRKYSVVEPQAKVVESQVLAPAILMEKVQQAYPDRHVQLYIPPRDEDDAARFSLIRKADVATAGFRTPSITVFQNPYSGEILGSLDPAKTLYTRIKVFHGTLYIGTLGDRLMEIASGLAVLLVLSGLYLAWPRRKGRQTQTFSKRPLQRKAWRYLHKVIGLTVALPLLFFLFSGLAWTGVWGGKLVQPWSAIPKPDFIKGDGHHGHASLNREGVHQVPWVLEATPVPDAHAHSHTHHHGGSIDLNDVERIAETQGFETYRVSFPGGSASTWVLSATTSAGDTHNPSADRTLHLDPSTGEIMADLKFADYPLLGKAMAAGIPLHEGDLGLWNWLLNLVLVSLIVFMVASGVIMWWKRRPANANGLLPPVAPPALSKVVVVVALVVAACFPLSAAVLLVVIALDWLLISRVSALRAVFK